MGFMQEDIQYGRWIKVDGKSGTEVIPFGAVFNVQSKKRFKVRFSDIKDFTTYRRLSDIESIDVVDGYGARLSASGYLDCTEWAVFKTEDEAMAYLQEMYGEG